MMPFGKIVVGLIGDVVDGAMILLGLVVTGCMTLLVAVPVGLTAFTVGLGRQTALRMYQKGKQMGGNLTKPRQPFEPR